MSNALSIMLVGILADPIKRHAFQELCAIGEIHAEGKPVRYEFEREGARIHITDVVEPRFKWIPTEDFRELLMSYWDGEVRLDGAREHYTPELVDQFKGWRFIRFPKSELIKLAKSFCEPRPRARRNDALNAAIKRRLESGEDPGRNIPWDTFCVKVRDDCNGWTNRKQNKAKNGFGDKTIQRRVPEMRLTTE